MKREYIAKGKTIDEAINAAAKELGVDRDDLSIEILDTPFKGFLGIGSTPARIKATCGEDDEISELIHAPIGKTEPEKKPEKRQERKPEKKQDKKPEKKIKKEKPVQVAPAETEEEPKELDEVSLKAKEFVEKTIQLMGVTDYNIKVIPGGKTIRISLTGKNMGVLIGKRGETMYAIQYLTSLAVNKEDGQFARIEFDVENYRQKRTAALEKLAVRMAEKVVKNRRNMTLEAMQAYERRVIHATLQDYPHVNTRSVGEEPYRKVVIYYEK